eukprot:scaffold17415_cov147-Isochrysis_galbana.AAC.5
MHGNENEPPPSYRSPLRASTQPIQPRLRDFRLPLGVRKLARAHPPLSSSHAVAHSTRVAGA